MDSKKLQKNFHDIKVFLILASFALILGVSGTLLTESYLEKKSEEHFNLVCTERSWEINTFFEKTAASMNAISAVVQANLENESDLYHDKVRSRFVKRIRNVLGEYLSNSVAKSAESLDYSVLTAYLRFDPRYEKNGAAGIFLGVEKGEVKSYPITDLEMFEKDDIEHVGWYYIPANSKKAQWLEPYFNKNISRSMISYVVPITKGKVVVGVLGVDIDITALAEKVARTEVMKGGFSYLAAKNGEPIAFTRKSAKNNIEKQVRLKNDMMLVVSVPRAEVFPSKYGNLHITLLALYIIFIAITLIVVFAKIQRYLLIQKNSEAEEKNNPTLKDAVRAELLVAATSAILMVSLQSVFVLHEFSSPRKKVAPAIQPQNTFERTLTITGREDFEPYCFLTDEGMVSGFFPELIAEIANRQGFNVEFKLATESKAKFYLTEKRADVLLGLEVLSQNTEEGIIASDAASEDSFIAVGKEKINNILEFRGKKIAASTESAPYDLYNLNSFALIYNNPLNELMTVEKGENDYALIRTSIFKMVASRENIFDIEKVYDLMESHMGFGVSEDRVELRNELNAALRELKDDGTLSKLQSKWLVYNIKEHSIINVFTKNTEFFVITGLIFIFSIGLYALLRLKFKVEYAELAAGRFRLLSETDALTGIRNRGSGEAEIKRLIVLKKYGMFCLFDADKFKAVNDTFGHEAGDSVIKALANAMNNALREYDIFMRLGGDEFAFYAVGIQDEDDGRAVIERLFDFISQISIPELKGQEVHVSLGASFFTPKSLERTFDDLYKRADKNLYNSKKLGGNAYSFWAD